MPSDVTSYVPSGLNMASTVSMWSASYWPRNFPCRLYEIRTPSGVNSRRVTDVVFSASSPKNSSSVMFSTTSTWVPYGVTHVIEPPCMEMEGPAVTRGLLRSRETIDLVSETSIRIAPLPPETGLVRRPLPEPGHRGLARRDEEFEAPRSSAARPWIPMDPRANRG